MYPGMSYQSDGFEDMKIIEEIARIKREKKAVILAHNYQRSEVQDIAAFCGDSFELARKSADIGDCEMVVFCGVKFMGETAKILSPAKKIVMPEIDIGCPLADMAAVDDVREMKNAHPEAWVVSYVNTNAEIKALTDVCCTSSNAEKIVRKVPSDKVIFLPDRNLCGYVRRRVPEKEFICWDGYCYVHQRFTAEDVRRSRELYPGAEIIVHPECPADVQDLADGIYSTSGILKRARESDAETMIIGTESGLLHRLSKENPGKKFLCLGPARICVNMKKITLEKVLRSLESEEYEIELDEGLMEKARVSLDRMIDYTTDVIR